MNPDEAIANASNVFFRSMNDKEKLLQEAEKALDRFQPEIALKFFERIYQNGNDYSIANQIGSCFLQLNQLKEAEEWLLKSLDLEPSQFCTLLQLGQLKSGQEAASLYLQGINLGTNMLNSNIDDENLVKEVPRHISSALCALCELFMTDLCDEADAEANCEEFMKEALRLDPENPEVYQTLASVRISQCNNKEALKMLEKGMDLWYQPLASDAELVIDSNWPLYNSRLALAKLFIEVESFDRALCIIETLEAENDEDPEVWYLYAWTYSQKAQICDAQENLSDAKEALQVLIEVFSLNFS